MDGSISLDAKLTGTPAQPGGSVRLSATGLRMRTGPGRAVPAANVTATAQLAGQSARIDARVTAGSAQLTVAGQAPLGAGALNLRASGGLDLTLLDPILTAGGRRARGRLTLDATVTGTVSAPRVSGTAQLAGGEVQDFTQGLRVSDIAASLRADGDTVRIVSFTGRAGPGTLSASGTVGVMAPGMPIDLTITAANARPIASDQLQLNLDANLTLRGHAADVMNLGGRILIRRAEITHPGAPAAHGRRAQGDPSGRAHRGPAAGGSHAEHQPRPAGGRAAAGLRPRARRGRRVVGRAANPRQRLAAAGVGRARHAARRGQRGRDDADLLARQGRVRRDRGERQDRPDARLRRGQHRWRRHGDAGDHRLCERAEDQALQRAGPAAGRGAGLPAVQARR